MRTRFIGGSLLGWVHGVECTEPGKVSTDPWAGKAERTSRRRQEKALGDLKHKIAKKLED